MRCFRLTGVLQLLLVALALITLAPGPVRAEGQSPAPPQLASIQGRVNDSQGRPLAGVAIHLQLQGAAQEMATRSDEHGQYRFPSLRPGAYTLRAELAGYASQSFGPFTLQAGPGKSIKLTLAPAAAAKNSAGSLQYFDEPQFTIAGVTDTTNLGGHASNATAPAKDELAREVANLNAPSSVPATETPAAQDQVLAAAREHLRADSAEKQGHPLEAAREYETAARLDPSEPNLFDWGAELSLHHAIQPAIEVFSQGHRLFPHSVRMLLGLGAAWFAQGSNQRATQYLCQASDLDPANSQPYLFLGKVQESETAPSTAIMERLARFARLRPDDAQANYYYALSLWKQAKAKADAGHVAQVESLLQKATQLDHGFASAYLHLGILYAEQKQYPEAISSYHKAIAASPRLPDAHYRLAQAYMRTGQKQKARAEMQRYDQLAKANAQEAERDRGHMQQFVYTLRTPASAPEPR
ncbi:MAG: tetratricopeptide repeat protein [Chlamydiota bacterium]